jgi:hypothetical protein
MWAPCGSDVCNCGLFWSSRTTRFTWCYRRVLLGM